jgi:hypothetical protein
MFEQTNLSVASFQRSRRVFAGQVSQGVHGEDRGGAPYRRGHHALWHWPAADYRTRNEDEPGSTRKGKRRDRTPTRYLVGNSPSPSTNRPP